MKTIYGTSITVSLQVTNDGGSIPISVNDYRTYQAANSALKAILAGNFFEISDTPANIAGLTSTDISTFYQNLVKKITSTGPLTFSISQAIELSNAGVTLDNVSASISDYASNIDSLTTDQIDSVAQLIGNSTITSKDTSVYLNAAQLNELYKDNLTVNVPSGSQVIFQDSDANIASFNVSLLPVLGVTEVQSTDVLGTTLFTLPAASVLSLAYENIPAYYSDGATPLTVVADTNANIGNRALTPAQIDTLQSYGITTIESTDGPLDLNAAQINELFNDGMTASAPPNNNVIFSDNVANIQTFLLNAIQNGNQNELSTVGVTEVQSLDIPFTLTIQEALVLATDFVPAYDADSAVAIIADTPSNIESLQPGDVDALELDGFTTIQNTTPGLLQLNAPLVIELALDGVKIVNGSQSTLYYDSASYFNNNSMDSQVLSALVGAGITGIETTDGPVAIYVAQFQDLPFSIIAPNGATSTIRDVAGAFQNLTSAQIASMPGLGFMALEAFDVPLQIGVAETQQLESLGIVTEGPNPSVNSTIVSDNANAIGLVNGQEGLTASQIIDLPSIGVSQINSNNGPVTIDTAQANAIFTTQLSVTGSSQGTIIDTAKAIEALIPDELGALSSDGFSDLTITDVTLQINADEAVAILNGGYTVNVPVGDDKIVADTSAKIGALTAPQIAGLEADGFLIETTPCYCRRTLILTDRGERLVEELAIGDRVATQNGLRPIKWIGRRGYDGRFIRGNREVLPIVVRAGALAEGVPARDLWLSPSHALLIDEILVEARCLVNGLSIAQTEAVDRVEYFHLEFEAHEVILAEGAAAESYVECDNRRGFHNAHEFAALYPDDTRPTFSYCLPRLEAGTAALATIRERLFARAEVLGYRTTPDPDLHLVVDGRVVTAQSTTEGRHTFRLDAAADEVWLASRCGVPAEMALLSSGRRRLGVCVQQLVLRDDHVRIEIAASAPSLCDGFHQDEEAMQRWTTGMAQLPERFLRPFAGGFTVDVTCVPPLPRYPLQQTLSLPGLHRSASPPQRREHRFQRRA
jgi:hypothetical protein